MKLIVACAFLLLVTALTGASATVTVTKDRTITKVVKLLQEMLEKSKAEGAKDKELYAKFKCFCDDNEEEKRTTIEELKQQIEILTSKIAEIRGSTGGLSTEVADLKAAMAENEAARKEATTLREKEHDEFVKTEADLSQAIGQMKEAIEVLSEIGADQTLQAGADHEQFMAAGGDEAPVASLLASKKPFGQLKTQVRSALLAASAFLTKKQRSTMESFLQAPFTGTYTAQSGEVVGILKNMKETFESNLEAATAAEKVAQEAYDKFMKTKEEEFETLSSTYEDKQGNLGSNDDDLASKREQLEEAKEQLAEDEDFLAKLLVLCAEKKKEYEARKLLRASEEAAISEAIAILNSDAAFESFGKVAATKTGSTGPALVQIASRRGALGGKALLSMRGQVEDILRKAASKAHRSLRLAKIAALLEAGNPFDIVLAEIEKVLALIDEEGEMDEENLEWCNKEREQNHADLDEHIAQITTLESEIEELNVAIHDPETGLLVQIAETEESITENNENQKTQTAARLEENKAYQEDVANIVETHRLLKKAIKVLTDYYGHKDEEAVSEEAAALLQRKDDPKDSAPTTWEDPMGELPGQSESGHKVIGMLEFILSEAEKEETVAHEDETKAQGEFEDSMADLKEAMKTLEETLTNLKETLAEKEKTLAEKKGDLEKTIAGKEAIEAYLEKIKPGCDFITLHIEERGANRKIEKAALEQAIELLKGTPAYKAAVNQTHQEEMADCASICNKDMEHVNCKACLAKVTIPGYCAGHPDTEGC